MSETKSKYWIGEPPRRCDLTDDKPYVRHKAMVHGFVDGLTRFGPWANMCLNCHHQFGVGLGVGKGQKYMPVQINGITHWQKVGG